MSLRASLRRDLPLARALVMHRSQGFWRQGPPPQWSTRSEALQTGVFQVLLENSMLPQYGALGPAEEGVAVGRLEERSDAGGPVQADVSSEDPVWGEWEGEGPQKR